MADSRQGDIPMTGKQADAVADAMEQTDPAGRALDAAMAIARNAPARRGTYVSHAKVYWPLIIELREALDALGVEWRQGRG